MSEPENQAISSERKENLASLFDSTIESYMDKYKISQGAACVMKDGEVLVSSGYGVESDTSFRIASLTKIFTRVSIMQLVEQGKTSLDTKVFPLLDLEPLPGKTYNSDLDKITISQLINHQAGWDQEVVGDPTFKRSKIGQEMIKALGKSDVDITPADMVRFMLSQPLQYEPGTRDRVYCNFGYSVLGRVIEKVSGQSYGAYIKENISKPLGLNSIQLGHTAKSEAFPNEARYEKDSSGLNENEDPYEDLCLEMADSAGGLISNAQDLSKFLEHYWANGYPRYEQMGHYFVSNGRSVGSLTLAIQRKDGINVVVLFNNRHNRDSKKDEELKINVETTIDKALT